MNYKIEEKCKCKQLEIDCTSAINFEDPGTTIKEKEAYDASHSFDASLQK